jgi:hypothetical protein
MMPAIQSGLVHFIRLDVKIMKTLFLFLMALSFPRLCMAADSPKNTSPTECFERFLKGVADGDKLKALACCVRSSEDKRFDAIIEYYIELRLLSLECEKKTVDPGVCIAILEAFQREELSSQSIAITIDRLSDVDLKIRGRRASLTILWGDDDSKKHCPFYYGKSPIRFLKMALPGFLWVIFYNFGSWQVRILSLR